VVLAINKIKITIAAAMRKIREPNPLKLGMAGNEDPKSISPRVLFAILVSVYIPHVYFAFIFYYVRQFDVLSLTPWREFVNALAARVQFSTA
jgi:hypothetical protein